ncbi:MAG: iron-regulated protein [Rhodospirillaceae bacterium]|nr:iron-regulated protein [Rhodospirillaceae bacterium]
MFGRKLRISYGFRLLKICLISLCVTSVPGATPGSASGGGDGNPLESYVSTYVHLVYENYLDSWDRARRLSSAIDSLLDNPNAQTLESARLAWFDSREPYGQTEAFRFYGGPIDYFDEEKGVEGPEGRMNSWPLDEAYIDYVTGNPSAGIINDSTIVLDGQTILGLNQIDDDRFVSTGYHAIEFLLWGQDLSLDSTGDRPAEDFLPGSLANDRRRDYMKIVTTQLLKDHEFLANEWAPGGDNFATKFEMLPPRVALGQILTGLLTLVQFELASERLGVALDSGDQEDEHSCFSDNTHNDFMYNARGVENVYFGRYSSYQGVGLDELVRDLDPDLDKRMVGAIEETRRLLKGIHVPFDAMLASPMGSPGRIQAEQAFASLMRQGELIKEVGLLFGLVIHSSDGDAG